MVINKKKNKNSNNFHDCTLRTVVVEDFYPVVSYEIGLPNLGLIWEKSFYRKHPLNIYGKKDYE